MRLDKQHHFVWHYLLLSILLVLCGLRFKDKVCAKSSQKFRVIGRSTSSQTAPPFARQQPETWADKSWPESTAGSDSLPGLAPRLPSTRAYENLPAPSDQGALYHPQSSTAFAPAETWVRVPLREARSTNPIFKKLDEGPFTPWDVRQELQRGTWGPGPLKRFLMECVRHRKYPELLETLDWMYERNMVADVQFYTRLMLALGDRRRADEALRVFDVMVNSRVVPDVFAFSAIIAALRLSGQPEQALTVYNLMVQLGIRPNPAAYSLVTLAYAEAEGWEAAWNFYHEWHLGHFPPELENYNTILTILGQAGQAEQVRQVLNDMVERGCTPTPASYAPLIEAYGARGDCEAAAQAFREVQYKVGRPDAACYTALIASHARQGQLEAGREVMGQMLQAGIPPTEATYDALLLACRRTGQYREGMRLYRELLARGLQPTVVTFEHLVAICRRAGRGDQAEELFEQMLQRGIPPDARFDDLLAARGAL